MKDWLTGSFTLLDRKRDVLILIVSTGVYSFLFMSVYNPFNITKFYRGGDWGNVIIFLKFSILAMLTLSVMEFVIRPIIKLQNLIRLTFALFLLSELVAFSLVIYISHGFITSVPAEGFGDFIDIFRYSVLVMALPYSAVLFYFHHHQIISNIPSISNHLIKIKDENDKLHLAINQDQILTLIATDNYVTVFYEKEGALLKELVRTSLKKLETEFTDTAIIRCSRSAMVNVKNIISSKTESRILVLDIKNMPNEPLRVSRNYKSKVLSILTNQVESN